MKGRRMRWNGMAVALASIFVLGLCGCSGTDDDAGGASGEGSDRLRDARDGKIYRTKTFGSQVWMAENLAVGEDDAAAPEGDAARIPRHCPQTWPDPSDPTPCDLYGGYYKYTVALALPETCDGQDCTDQLQVPHHQGICPDGWHIPTAQEFETLTAHLAAETGLDARDEDGVYTEVGHAVRVNSNCEEPGPDEPNVGFDAMLAGYANFTGYVVADRIWTNWHTTKHDESYSYAWGVSCGDGKFNEVFLFKSHALPVRCVRD